MSASLSSLRLITAFFLCGGCLSARAGNDVWTSASSGTWSNGANWSSFPAPGSTTSTTNTDTATFDGTTTETITIDQMGQNIGSIFFSGASTGSYTIGAANGNPLLLSSGGSITDSVGNINTEIIAAPLVLEPANSTANGNYTFTIGGGFDSAMTFTGAISGGTTSGSITLNLGSANPSYPGTINGVISNGGASGGLGITQTGGSWVLASLNNTYTGPTTVDGGSLSVSGAVSSSSALSLGGDGQFLLTSGRSQTVNGTTVTPGLSTIATQGSNSALHLGTLTHTTGGMVDISSLTPSSIYTTSSNEGQIIGPWAVYGSGSSLTYAASGGASSPISHYSFNTPTTSGSLANMTSATTQYTYSSSVNTIFLTKNITGDTLQFINTGDNYIETLGYSVTLNGLMNSTSGLLTVEGTGTVVTGASNELDIFNGLGNIKISSTITGTGALAYASVTGNTTSTLLTLAGANTYTGGTYINGGELSVASSGALGTTGTISFGGGTLQFTANNTTDYSSRFSTAADQLYSFDTNGQSVTLASNLTSSGGSLSDTGSGALVLTGANNFSGGVFLKSLGTVSLGSSGAIGSAGTIYFNGGTLQFTANNTTDYSSRFSSSPDQSYSFDTNGQAVTLAGNMTSSEGSLVKIGAGVLTLTGSNSFAGNTYLDGGEVNLGSGGALGTSGTIYFNGGSLQFSASNTTDYSSRFSTGVNQLYSFDTNGQSATIAGNLSSSGGSLTKIGTGTLTLSGSNTYTGGTSVKAGTLMLQNGTNGSATGSGPLSLALGATIGGAGTSHSSSFTINGNVMVGNGTDVMSQTTITGTTTSSFSGANLTFNLGAGTNQGKSNELNLGATPLSFLNTTLTFNLVGSGGIQPDTSFTLITTNGPINATADGLSLGANGQITGGLSIAGTSLFGASENGYTSGAYGGSYLYISGDDIDVEVVPEPSTWALLLGGLGVLCFWRTRRAREIPRLASLN